jgi:uncharacterized protein (UPF0276 family)
MNPGQFPVQGAGLGLRRALLGPLQDIEGRQPDFLEVAPENWIGVGGKLGRQFRSCSERYPLLVHGLSLSLGAPEPLDEGYIRRLRRFLDENDVALYSDHLSYCSEHGHLYDLMPLPFLEETVAWVADRIRRVQDLLERQIAVENISYYADPGSEMSELDFIKAVLERADCKLLLDVNNIHVNSVNHGYDADTFLDGLPSERVAYIHIAGHHHEAEDLIVDTHGAAVADPVWGLLGRAYERLGPVPTLLERDFNFPPLDELLEEVDLIRGYQERARDA